RLVAASVAECKAAGLEVTDESARHYHSKNELLTWCTRFELSWPVTYEWARITIRICYIQPRSTCERQQLSVSSVSEVFQTGKFSRLRETTEKQLTWSELRTRGIVA